MAASGESRTCQTCKAAFVIEPDDSIFYEQMKVPPPTWCPSCRRLRRMGWTGYRILYKTKCAYTGENIITFYHPESSYTIYRQDIWWSDQWDPKQYGQDYDFDRPFFEQFDELLKSVPLPSLHTNYTLLTNSDYCNAVGGLKNCYLLFQSGNGAAGWGCENCAYMHMVDDAKDSMEASFSNELELSYECLRCSKCFRTFYSQNCEECHDVYFSFNCVGSSNLIGCVNLRNQSYCIFNKKYSKEEYEKKLKEFDLGSRAGVEALGKQVREFIASAPQRNFHGRRTERTSGDYISHSKNVHDSYVVNGGENVRYGQMLSAPVANSYDYSLFGNGSEWMYECAWDGLASNTVKFCFWTYYNHHIEYCFGCHSSENLFGCVGIRKGAYCILNKQYSKEDYFAMVAKIKEQMSEKPYVDRLGRTYAYGEFFPSELSPWTYNESMASLGFIPLTKEEALARGFNWREDDARQYREATAAVPDRITDVPDTFAQEILKCVHCGKNYQIIKMELEFYRRMNIPVPVSCPLCREKERVRQMNPMDIHDRTCAKCGKAIQTSYAPAGPDVVYCEQCYQAEVA